MVKILSLQVVFKVFSPIISRSKYSTESLNKMGMPLKEIVSRLQSFASLRLAETWDNVGLLVDPMTDKNVNTVMLTNDLTEDVVNEAKNLNAGLIVTYHPNIFQGLKTISADTWKERIVVQCIKHEIAVFSPHTSWDCVEGGVNDWLATAFNFKMIKPINERADNAQQGSGRLLSLDTPVSVGNVVELIKKHVGVQHLRLALARNRGIDSMVSSVALCAGSGASVLKGVQADLYLTGEMSHHDLLDAAQRGIHVILCEHSNSERGFLQLFQKELKTKILEDKINVVVSAIDKDPVLIV